MGSVDNKEEIIDLDLSPIKKTKIRVNGDQNAIIELNLSDMNIVGRLKEAYGRLEALSTNLPSLADSIPEGETTEEEDVKSMEKLSKELANIDKLMRDEIDFIFDSPVSNICVPNGNMYDLHNGQFTYEHVIEALGGLFKSNLNEEYNRLKRRVSKHTYKYTSTGKGKKK